MSFTDEDLKKLKAALYGPFDKHYAVGGNGIAFKLNLNSLVERMEAAEVCIESLDDLLHHGVRMPNGAVHESNPDIARQSIEAWKAAAGR